MPGERSRRAPTCSAQPNQRALQTLRKDTANRTKTCATPRAVAVEPLPTVDVSDVASPAHELLTKLERVASKRGIAVNYVELSAGTYGLSKQGTVDIGTGHTTGQQAKTLTHELAHEALHWEDRGSFTHSIAELEAESVAYVVCQHFGLDVEVRASRYIALSDGDSKALRESLERIATTARDIIDDVDALNAGRMVA